MKHILQTRWRKMLAVSRGASIAMVSEAGGFTAYLKHAETTNKLVGHLGQFIDLNDDVLGDCLAQHTLPVEKMPEVISKLTTAGLSVALLDHTTEGLYALVHVVPASKKTNPDEDVLA